MTANWLNMNIDKTDFIWLGSNHQVAKSNPSPSCWRQSTLPCDQQSPYSVLRSPFRENSFQALHDHLQVSPSISLQYFQELRVLVTASTSRHHLRSVTRGDLQVPAGSTSSFGPCSFAACAPKLWNYLPSSLCDPTLTLFCSS